MKNVKINLDRPSIDSKSIQAHKDFDGLMKNHAMMSKPFYKSPWFIGTTGIASVSILVGGIVAFNSNQDQIVQEVPMDSQAPPEIVVPDNRIIAMNSEIPPKETTELLVKDTFKFSNNIQKNVDDNNNTLDQNNTNTNNNSDNLDETTLMPSEIVELYSHDEKHDDAQDQMKNEIDFSALMPRIGGKINGSISRDELFDNKGITTESDVSVIHFELHLIDGLGGEVLLQEESNQLNEEMKAALQRINSGETIYFENIKGKTDKGNIVRLNPLRYVLMN
jgi:hypothetical protein